MRLPSSEHANELKDNSSFSDEAPSFDPAQFMSIGG
jgi:hypothetical protein